MVVGFNLIDHTVQHKANSKRVYIVPKDTIVCRLIENCLNDFHESRCQVLVHQRIHPNQKSQFCLVSCGVIFEMLEEDVEDRQLSVL